MLFYLVMVAAVDWGFYRFHDNIGGVFYDYSGNSYHGINGQQIQVDSKDVTHTDRGAYFDGVTGLISLHNQIWETPSLPESWSLFMWAKPVHSGIVLLRQSKHQEIQFQISFSENSEITLQIKTSNQTDYSVQSLTSISPYTFNDWVFLSVKIVSDCQALTFTYNLEINDQSQSQQTLSYSSCYKQQGTILTFIGAKEGPSLIGWVYDTRFSDQNSSKTDQSQFSPGCNQTSCYFGENSQMCSCTNCADNVCISQENSQIIAGDGSVCIQCQGMCTYNSICVECSNQKFPTCQKDGTSLSNQICYYQCGGCFGPEANQCLTCASTYANLVFGACSCPQNSIQILEVCTCLYGYGLVEDEDGYFACDQCEIPCKACSGSTSYCLECVDSNAQLISGVCECPENSQWQEDECVCKEGFYEDCLTCPDLRCLQCDPSCLTCKGPDRNDCLSCRQSDLFIEEDSSCFSCPQGQYISQEIECENCFFDCETCTDYQICTSCADQDKTIDENGECVLFCEKGFYSIGNSCEMCPGLCSDCIEDGLCVECNENALLLGYFCVCQQGYYQEEDQCFLSDIECEINTENVEEVKLEFSKELDQDLTEGQIEVTIEFDPEFQYSVSYKNYTAVLEMTYKEKIYRNSKINIEIKKNLVGKDGSSLGTHEVSGNLEGFTPEDIRYIEVLVAVFACFSIVSCYILLLIKNQCSLLWSLMTTMQYLSYLALTGNPLTPYLRSFLISLNKWLLYPNFLQKAIGYTGSRPYDEAVKYGIVYNDFIATAGKQIMLLLVIVTIAVVVSLLNCSKKISLNKSFIQFKQSLFFSAFIRFWILFYMDFAVFSILRVFDVIFTQVNQQTFYSIFDFIVAGVVLSVIFKQLVVVLMPIFMFFLIKMQKQRFLKAEQVEFYTKWSALIREFNIRRTEFYYQYYFVFFLRRIFTVGSLVLFHHYPTFQAITIMFYCFVFFIYLIKYCPFVDKKAKFINILMECLTFSVVALLTIFIWNLQDIFREFLGFIVIVIISSVYFFTVTYIYYSFAKSKMKTNPLSLQIQADSPEKVRATDHEYPLKYMDQGRKVDKTFTENKLGDFDPEIVADSEFQ